MNNELKPCPFCSNNAKLYESCSEELPYGVGCTNEECHIYSGYGMKLYETKGDAIRGWNKRKRARAKFDNCEGDTCSISIYDGMIYCSCGRALRRTMNFDMLPYKCPDCKRKIKAPDNLNEVPVINVKRIGEDNPYKATADGRIMSGIKFLKPAMGRSGYPMVTMKVDGKQQHQVIKYLVAKAFLDIPEDKDMEYVININGDVWDNRVENLKWVNTEEYAAIQNGLTREEFRNEMKSRLEYEKRLAEERGDSKLYNRIIELLEKM